MDTQVKAMIGLATYTACADAEFEKEELQTIAGYGMALLGATEEIKDVDVTFEKLIETMAGFVDSFDKDADDYGTYVSNLLRGEAQIITDNNIRILALNFCMMVAEADEEVEEGELAFLSFIHHVWADMNDGWDYSWTEAIEKAFEVRGA